MTVPRPLRIAGHLGFAAALLAATSVREGPSHVINKAIIWLPTGVAIAGLWLLGLRAAWIVAAATLVQRWMLSYDVSMGGPAALGSTTEAVLGVLVLRRLGFRSSLDRLRDAGAVLVAAVVAPLGSILFSWLARSVVWSNPHAPFYSGWDGWWRMNALGVLTVVPVVVVWAAPPRPVLTLRRVSGIAATLLAIPAVLLVTMLTVPSGPSGVLALHLALGLALYAGVRFGVRGATLVGTLSALTVAMATTRGLGPFVGLPDAQRHTSVQLFELAFVAIPTAFGALVAERQAAQASGEQSDVLRRSMESVLPDILYRIRRDGTVLEVSVPRGTAPPFPATQMIGRSIFDFLPPDRHEAMRRSTAEAFARNEVATFEYELVVQGRRTVREARCVPAGHDEMLAVVRDISERKWSEGTRAFETRVLALVATGRPSCEVFAELVRGIEELAPGSQGSVIVLEQGRMHVAMAPALPASYNALLEGQAIGPTVGSCGAAASTGRTVVARDIAVDPLWAPYRDGALRHGLHACWSVPIRDSRGEVLGTIAIYHGEPRDPAPGELALAERAGALAGIALERERWSEALRRSEDLLASVNRNQTEGLLRVTPDLRVRYANLALARLFGHAAPEDVVGTALSDAAADVASDQALRQRIAGESDWRDEEIRFRRRDGSTFWALLSGTAVRDDSGVLVHYDGALADITARKELEEQFRQSQKMEAVGKLAGGVAHDFNNLLTVIVGYAETIRAETDANQPVRAHADHVLDAAARASGLTRQLLAFSRQQVLSPQVLDLTAVVDQMGAMLQRLIGEAFGLVVTHRSGPCWVRVDHSQLEQVLLNLVVNARDAMPDGGAVAITTGITDAPVAAGRGERIGGPRVVLGVRDEGVGMAPEVQARAFDPFFTTKAPGKGTGLGLSTVYGIVKQSGGAVWIESAPDAGTTAFVELPRVAPPDVPAPAPSGTATGSLEATVLVVEDEPIVRQLVCRTLERAGYRVIEAGDGIEATERVRSHAGHIDLVVTDVVMPRMGGRELAASLLAHRPGLRFLFVSGYPDDARESSDFAGAAGGFLAKPFAPRQLVERVHGLLGSA